MLYLKPKVGACEYLLDRLKVAWMKGSNQVIWKTWAGLLLLLQTPFPLFKTTHVILNLKALAIII